MLSSIHHGIAYSIITKYKMYQQELFYSGQRPVSRFWCVKEIYVILYLILPQFAQPSQCETNSAWISSEWVKYFFQWIDRNIISTDYLNEIFFIDLGDYFHRNVQMLKFYETNVTYKICAELLYIDLPFPRNGIFVNVHFPLKYMCK